MKPAPSDDFLAFAQTVGSLNRSLLAVGEGIASSAGLTHVRSQCLQHIADAPLTVAAIAARLSATRQGVQRTADLLVDAGLAVFVDNPRHRRAKLLTPTPTGQVALGEVRAAHARWVRDIGADLSSADADVDGLTARLQLIEEAVQRSAGGR